MQQPGVLLLSTDRLPKFPGGAFGLQAAEILPANSTVSHPPLDPMRRSVREQKRSPLTRWRQGRAA